MRSAGGSLLDDRHLATHSWVNRTVVREDTDRTENAIYGDIRRQLNVGRYPGPGVENHVMWRRGKDEAYGAGHSYAHIERAEAVTRHEHCDQCRNSSVSDWNRKISCHTLNRRGDGNISGGHRRHEAV